MTCTFCAIYNIIIELALRRDERLISLLADFESQQTDDAIFLQKIHDAIGELSKVNTNKVHRLFHLFCCVLFRFVWPPILSYTNSIFLSYLIMSM